MFPVSPRFLPGLRRLGCALCDAGGQVGRAGLALVLLGLLVLSARAEPADQLSNWRTEQGLPSNKIMTVVQSPDGYIWAGSYEGLVRFDGVKFTRFDSSNVPGWKDSSVTSLYVARDGTLWIGHSSGAISAYREGEFTVHPPRRNWAGSKVQNIGGDENGEIWIQNDLGELSRLRDGRVLLPEKGQALGLQEMTCSAGGGLWVASLGKLSRLRGDHLETVPLAPEMDPYVHGICASEDGGVWVIAGGYLWKWLKGEWRESPGPLVTGGTPVQPLIETRDHRLIGGTSDHGLVLINPADRSRDRQLWRPTGFPSDWVLSACEDHEGGLWIATGTAGLFRRHERKVMNLLPPDEWQGRAVLSVSPARDGGFWVGTEGAGLYRLRDGAWTNFAKDAGIRNPYIWSVYEDRSGALWLGTWGGSVYTRHGDHFVRAPGLEDFAAPVTAIAPAHDGGLWIGSTLGVMHYAGARIEWIEPEQGRRIRNVRTIVESPGGTLWFGSNGDGLGEFRAGKLRQYRQQEGLPGDYVQSLYLDSRDTLWIGTRGGGLTRLRDGHLSTIRPGQGLADASIAHIEEDGLGFFWFSSSGGIFRVARQELEDCADGRIERVHSLSYGLSDGLLSLAASGALQPGGCQTPEGKLVFATDRALAVIDPGEGKLNTHAPPVSIESLRAGDRIFAEDIFPEQPIEIPPGQYRIEIKYTGLSFAAPEKVHFKRRLEGLEPRWVAVGDERLAVYNYLPPGKYRFHVTAANNDDVWNADGKSVSFVILPHFWQTLWFRLLVLVLLLAITASLVWFQARRRLQRRLERLERERAIERERTRIANDMHDDLGSHLTRITMLSETARSEVSDQVRVEAGLNQIYDTARDVTRAMDEIVWAVNPRHDTLESLVFYFEKFALDLLGAAGIRCRLELPSEIPDWHPRSEVRHNLFLAYKEALNNAARHSGATTVTVRLELEEKGCTLTVSDDGRGLSDCTGAEARPEAGRFSSGNGLKNMAARMERIGGRCSVEANRPGGCTVSLSVPMDF
jgi:signal transduction histidine kinase/ligand-binding sensor domain-containing protein